MTLAILGLVTIGLAAGLPRLRTEFGYRVLIGDDHPAIQALDGLIEKFGGGLPLYIMWGCGEGSPCLSVFDPASLRMAHSLTNEIAPLPEVKAVDGVSNSAILSPLKGGFSVRRLVENGEPANDVGRLSRRALEDPMWTGNLISRDGLVGVIVVQPIDSNHETAVRVVRAVEGILPRYEREGFQFHLAGDPFQNVVSGRDLANSTARLIPFTILVIALVLFVLSRSWRTVAIVLVTMAVALIWTFGVLGWLDWPRDGILEVLAPLILIVGVCDAVHWVSRYEAESAASGFTEFAEKRKLILKVVSDIGSPCLITTLTTAGAFASFITSALDTFVRFGAISAFGVVGCLFSTFSLLPILVSGISGSRHAQLRSSRAWSSFLGSIVRVSEDRRASILSLGFALLVFCGIGWAAFLRMDTRWSESFGEKSQVVQSIQFMEDHLGKSETLEIQIDLPHGERLESPSTLRHISDLTHHLSSLDSLGSATSVLDLIGRLNRLLHDDDLAYQRFANSMGANAEIIELIGFDDPEVLANWMTLDRNSIRVSVEAPEQPYSERRKLLESIRDYTRSALPPDWTVVLTGESAIGADWIRDVQNTQIRSFPTALMLVVGMVAIFLRSLRLAAAALLVTLLPVVVTLGTMGWVGMSLDVGRAMIAAILLGIAVDDSIHILDQYRRYRTRGLDPHESIREAILHTGRAVVTTSLALSLGFLTLMASAWQTISSFGFFVSLAILGALAAALFVLPALIFAFARSD